MVGDQPTAILALCYALAIGFIVSIRLSIRKWVHWGLDDVSAVIGGLGLGVTTVLLWVKYKRSDFMIANRSFAIASTYILCICLMIGDWSPRLTILFSLLRLPTSQKDRIIVYSIAAYFLTAFCATIAFPFVYCPKQPNFQYGFPGQPIFCVPKHPIQVMQAATGFPADVILMSLMVYAMCKAKTNLPLRRRLYHLCVSSFLLFLSFVVEISLSFGIPQGGYLTILTPAFVGLLISNSTLVVTVILHLMGSSSSPSSVDGSKKNHIGSNGELGLPTENMALDSVFSLSTRDTSSDSLEQGRGSKRGSVIQVMEIEGIVGLGVGDELNGSSSGEHSIHERNATEIGGYATSLKGSTRSIKSIMERWRTLDVDRL